MNRSVKQDLRKPHNTDHKDHRNARAGEGNLYPLKGVREEF